jgi:hypothetical protein
MHPGPYLGGVKDNHPPPLYLLNRLQENFPIEWADYSDLIFLVMKGGIVARPIFFLDFWRRRWARDGIAYQSLHRPHCTRDKIMFPVPSPIKPLLQETIASLLLGAPKHFFCNQALDFSRLDSAHSAVVPFVDPNIIQSPFPCWTRAKSAAYLVEALTHLVNNARPCSWRHRSSRSPASSSPQ